MVCPDDLGLSLLLQGALSPVANTEDIFFYDAGQITREKARQIEVETRFAPRGSSKLQHFFIYSLQKLPTMSVGPLLKTVEDAKYARFIFQAQSAPRKIHTLMSRCSTVRLPFLPKKTVLANLSSMNQDARTADENDLYDGTLAGTLKALSMKDTMAAIKREMKRGQRGMAAVYSPEVLDSLAFAPATYGTFDENERRFLATGATVDRKKIALYLAMTRRND